MQRCGATFRAVRIKRGWRQIDLALRAGVHRSVISNIERGHLEHVSVGTLLYVARALEIQVTFTTRWRGGDLDRMLSSRHAGLHEAVARWFANDLPEWVLAPEVSYSIYGERGVIDILAWDPGRRSLLVIELKTDIVDVNDLIGAVDRRRRLAREIARERGWEPLTVSTWVLVAGSRTNRHGSRPTELSSGMRSRSTGGIWRDGYAGPPPKSTPYPCGTGPPKLVVRAFSPRVTE